MQYDPRFTEVGRKRAWGLVVDRLAGGAIAIASLCRFGRA
jgi:hypothetical protein